MVEFEKVGHTLIRLDKCICTATVVFPEKTASWCKLRDLGAETGKGKCCRHKKKEWETVHWDNRKTVTKTNFHQQKRGTLEEIASLRLLEVGYPRGFKEYSSLKDGVLVAELLVCPWSPYKDMAKLRISKKYWCSVKILNIVSIVGGLVVRCCTLFLCCLDAEI